MNDAYANALKEHEGDRREAFKRIDEQFYRRRRRMKEKLRWYQEHPSPRHPTEKLENLIAALEV